MLARPNFLVPADFPLDPSRRREVDVRIVSSAPTDAQVLGVPVTASGEVPEAVGLGRAELRALGFTASQGATLVVPSGSGPTVIAVGVGDGALGTGQLRDASAALARAASGFTRVASLLAEAADPEEEAEPVTEALVEGAVLARYRYDALKTDPTTVPLERLYLVGGGSDAAVQRALTLAHAGMLARDLASAPPAHLTATRFADLAAELGPQYGLEVDVYDREQLIELGCGGLLGVNAGSVEEPRMVRLRYRVEHPAGHLGLVGKGIMYDSGGIALKPGDVMHQAMKMDMSGAAAVFSAMLALRDLDCPSDVTGYLMCTDNMPSGSATALGDVLHMRSGTTVEVKNTDAEGRLVMADALALATEEGVDAVIDIATLTGAALRALGTLIAPVFGNDQRIVDQVMSASRRSGEELWQLPLDRRLRRQLDSVVADLANIGGPHAGATTAALFLAEFVGDTPWAHLDIAGTMQSDRDDAWRTKGPTGFGARLLAEFATAFAPTR